MYIICKVKGAEGFEDQLTAGQDYTAIETGVNGYRLIGDDGCLRWYGAMHFTVVD